MPYGRRGGGMLGSEEGRSVFFFSFSLALASGRWNSSESMGRGIPAMKRRIPSVIRFDKAGGMARHGRDAIRADDGLLGLTRSEGSVGVPGSGRRGRKHGICPGAARQPARFVAISGRREREAILSDMRSVMLRLGDAPAGRRMPCRTFSKVCPGPPSGREDVSEPYGWPFATRGAFQNVR